MMNVLSYVAARLNEASTWAAISALLLTLGVNVDPGLMHALALWGGVTSAVLGFLIQEETAGKSPEQILKDGFTALVALANKPPANSPPQQGPHA